MAHGRQPTILKKGFLGRRVKHVKHWNQRFLGSGPWSKPLLMVWQNVKLNYHPKRRCTPVPPTASRMITSFLVIIHRCCEAYLPNLMRSGKRTLTKSCLNSFFGPGKRQDASHAIHHWTIIYQRFGSANLTVVGGSVVDVN